MMPSAAAIVGGHSTEVVQQILNRLADSMLTIVKGSPADQKDLAIAQAQAESDKKKANEKVEMTKLLSDIKNDISNVTACDPSKAAALKSIGEAIDSI